jgi:hypothetical protein
MSSQTRWWSLPDPSAPPPRGPTIDAISNSVVDVVGPADSIPEGAHHRRHLQNSVADAVGPAGSTSQGASHRRHLTPRWWTLPDPLVVPPRGPTIDVVFKPQRWTLNPRPTGSTYQGASHRCRLKPQRWMLLDPPAVPPGGPPSRSSSKLGGGRCRTR